MQSKWLLIHSALPVGPDAVHSCSREAPTARELGVIAAKHNAYAFHIADRVPAATRSNSHWKFSSAVIASNANKSTWPKEHSELDGNSHVNDRVVFSPSDALLDESIAAGTTLKGIALPADMLAPFLDRLARREVKSSDMHLSAGLREVRLLPPVTRNVTLRDIFVAMSKNPSLLPSLQTLSVTGTLGIPGGESEFAELTTLLSMAKGLNAISICRCGAQHAVSQIVNAVKDGTVEHLSLESNDLGLGNGDADTAESIRTAIAEMLRGSKFLLSLNLGHNNFNSEAVRAFFQALVESDTKLSLDDLAEQRASKGEKDDGELVPVQDLVDRALFFGDPEGDEGGEGSAGDDDRDPAFDSEEKEEDEAEQTWPEQHDRQQLDEDEEREDEEAEELEGEGESAPSGAEAEEEEDEEDEEGVDEVFQPDPMELRRIQREMREITRGERASRAALQEEYLAETTQVAQQLTSIRQCLAEEKQKEAIAFCKRRSGWSHLQSVTLRGNSVGDRGARSIAQVLRSTVSLGEEEVARTEEELRGKLSELVEVLRASRHDTAVEEAKARQVFSKEAKRLARSFRRAAQMTSRQTATTAATSLPVTEEQDEYVDDEDDEFQHAAPPVVMTNIEAPGADEEEDDVEDGDEEDNDTEVDPEVEEEKFGWEEAAATVRLPISPTKAGMNSITFLDLGSCEIGSRGLEAIAQSLADNSTLRTLILRNNSLVGAAGATKQSAIVRGERTGDVVSPGFSAFSAMLQNNTALTSLDLGFCALGPSSLCALAQSLACNTALERLNLEGNEFGSSRGCQSDPEGATPSALLTLLLAVNAETSVLRRVNLSHNSIGDSLGEEEALALARLATSRLTHLSLCNTGMRSEHVARWVGAVHEELQEIESPKRASGAPLESLHMSRNSLAGEEAGQHLGRLLAFCGSLRELNVDENPRLTSRGLAKALNALPSPCSLSWLSCNGTGLSTPSVTAASAAAAGGGGEPAEQFVVPPHVMTGLRYLALGDLDTSDDGAEAGSLEEWANQLLAQSHQLRYLSLWSRHAAMEEHLEPLERVVADTPTLHFVDFGVLLRFDMDPDLKDCLGRMERMLVSRRVITSSSAV